MYSAGQFVLFAYMAPVMRDQAGLSIDQFSLVLVWLGFWGVIGNLVISQFVDRIGAAKMVNISMLMIGGIILAAGHMLWLGPVGMLILDLGFC